MWSSFLSIPVALLLSISFFADLIKGGEGGGKGRDGGKPCSLLPVAAEYKTGSI